MVDAAICRDSFAETPEPEEFWPTPASYYGMLYCVVLGEVSCQASQPTSQPSIALWGRRAAVAASARARTLSLQTSPGPRCVSGARRVRTADRAREIKAPTPSLRRFPGSGRKSETGVARSTSACSNRGECTTAMHPRNLPALVRARSPSKQEGTQARQASRREGYSGIQSRAKDDV